MASWVTLNNGTSVRYLLSNEAPSFPSVEYCLTDPAGLIQIGGALTPEWLLAGYQRGIFPWFSEGDPILWWCPNPRTILIPNQFKRSRSLAKVIRNAGFSVTFDQNFSAVIQQCAHTRAETWIMPNMIKGYTALHKLGYAHSVEVWQQDQLVGGLYGVALGGAFFGESMFSLVSNASKVALGLLCQQLHAWQFTLIDCQFTTNHLLSLGAQEVSREAFLYQLTEALTKPSRLGSWASVTASDHTDH
jgi:leucyl/phenylalanyl-tRNA---protein transferase